MENDFLSSYKKIIREANYDNTYKTAWARSIVEICASKQSFDETIKITFKEIAVCYFKYYWNQTIFFNLIQGSNIKKPPTILQIVKDEIYKYHALMGNNSPIMFERIENTVLANELKRNFDSDIVKIIRALKENVSWRFLNLDNKTYDLYDYIKGNDYLYIKGCNAKLLKENHTDLFELINYRWGLILETFNSSPKINKKVKIIDEREVKRASLDKFKKYLDLENPKHICSICGKPIDDNDLSIDHVIPWSYLFSDDLWNLIYAHRGCNSCKSNRIPEEDEISKLKERNKKLLEKAEHSGMKDKPIDELKLCIEHDYVDKFWMGCK